MIRIRTYYDHVRHEFVISYDAWRHREGVTEERYSIADVVSIAEPRENSMGDGYVMQIELRSRDNYPFRNKEEMPCKFHTFPVSKDDCYTMFLRMADDHYTYMHRN